MTTKTLDSKGRLTLGARYAGQTVLVDESSPNQIMIKPVVMVPSHEAWLFQNKTALALVRNGLEEARQGVFAHDAEEDDLSWLDDVDD